MLDDRQCRLKISIKIFLYVKLKASFLGFYDISKKRGHRTYILCLFLWFMLCCMHDLATLAHKKQRTNIN